MSRIVFSEAARQDRRAITEYTVERFGIQQARRLRDRFEAVLHSLVEAPLIGHKSPELDPPCHTFRYLVVARAFLIVYEATEEGIRIARLLHGARNLAVELARDAGEDGD